VETELRQGYSGTARRKGRQQTNRTYRHRATSRLYRSVNSIRRPAAVPADLADHEPGTLESLKANRKAIFDPRVTAHDGRLVKLMGDGALVEFASLVCAVNRAHGIQQATESQPGLPAAERIRCRIGINLGEVIVEGDDIYGDGVNVAARLQALVAQAEARLAATE
jgi:class 3 adenylate cyclase